MMDTRLEIGSRARSWWLALLVMVAATWGVAAATPAVVVMAVAALALGLARPRGWAWLAWLATLPVLVVVVFGGRATPMAHDEMAKQLSGHCQEMLVEAEHLADDPRLGRLLATTGEALDPAEPFELLADRSADATGRTLYLADDRGQLVAWAGESRAYPADERPLGLRRWGLRWSAGEAVLLLREPVLAEGRLIGAVTLVDRSPLEAETVWGVEAPSGRQVRLGSSDDAIEITVAGAPGITVPISSVTDASGRHMTVVTVAWLVFIAAALIAAPAVAAVAIATVWVFGPVGSDPVPVMAILIMAWALAVFRLSRGLSLVATRVLIGGSVVAAVLLTVLTRHRELASWLPAHLLDPGWAGAWAVAIAWILAAWSRSGRDGAPRLGRLLTVAAVVAALALVLGATRVFVELVRWAPSTVDHLPRAEELNLAQILPVPPDACDLGDLAPVLAERWRLGERSVPSELRLLDERGDELSRWGDLGQVEASRLERTWELQERVGARVELWAADGPWRMLADWNAVARGGTDDVRFVTFTRAGTVAASLHPEVRPLPPAVAGNLYHEGVGWTTVQLGESRQPARVVRQGDWLVAAVARTPAPSVWAVKTAIAWLWALVGLLMVCPPSIGRQQIATFGGRLRLLVAGGVVVPLIILTLFLHLRLDAEERRLESAFGLDGLRSARYTVVHFGGDVPVDDELARWLARGWGGEAAIFDGADAVAVSRRDLMTSGVLPELPAARAYTSFLLGRDDAIVAREPTRLVAAGPVELEGRPMLLHLYRIDPVRAREGPGAVDWLLTGALLAALVVLVVSARVEERLSLSLRNLVRLSDTLLRGEPPADVPRPRETDLAGVLDAFRAMHDGVRRRELSLRHQEELLRITLATLAPAVMVVAVDMSVRFTNPAAERLLADHGDGLLSHVRRLSDQRDGSTGALVETLQPRPGEELTWRMSVADVPLPDGSPGLVAVIDDVTDLMRADRLRQLNQLARIVAHEVKNPLTPVRLWVQELEEARRRKTADLGSLVDEACREISVQVERLQETAASFSNLVALEQWQPQAVDLGELAVDVTGSLAVVERHGVHLVRTLPDHEVRVIGDRNWLRRAVSNLLRNSLDALGDEPGRIELSVRSEDGLAVLEVADSGGGVPDSQLQDLFEPHFSTTSGGSGLGLALVRQVVTRCHGRVAASNGADGLIVRLELPLSRQIQAD